MSTMEHLFMQIFDRKRWIEDQLKHQVESHGESLAANVLAEGKRPPPWLWTSRFDGPSWLDLKEWNGEQIISEMLDPLPRVTTPANNNSLMFRPVLKENNPDQLNSNTFFTKTFASDKYFEASAVDEVVSNSVPEGSKKNSEMMVEPEFTSNCSQLSQPAMPQTSSQRHNEPEMPPKIVNRPFEDNSMNNFTGRVTRSMASSVNHDYVKTNSETTRSRSKTRKYHSVGQASKFARRQKDVLSVSSESTGNDEFVNLVQSACDAQDGCPLTNSLSSKLSAITLLSEPDNQDEGLEECHPNANVSSASTFEVENNVDNADVPVLEAADVFPFQVPSSSLQPNEDLLHVPETIWRIEEADRNPTEGSNQEMLEVVDFESDSGMINPSASNGMTCHISEYTPVSSLPVSNCKLNKFLGYPNEWQVGNRESEIKSLQQRMPEEHCTEKMTEFFKENDNIFRSNDMCNLDNNSVASAIRKSKNGLEASCTELNSASQNTLVPEGFPDGSKSEGGTSLCRKIEQEDISKTVRTLNHRGKVESAANGASEEPEQSIMDSVCLTHPTSSTNDCWIFENVLPNSSPRKGCLSNSSVDSSGDTSELSDISRKNSFTTPVQCIEEMEYCEPKEVLAYVAPLKKSEDNYYSVKDDLPLSRIEEHDSSENLIGDSNVVNRLNTASANGQAEISDIFGIQDLRSDSHVSVCTDITSLPAVSQSKDIVTADLLPDSRNILNSMQGLSVEPYIMQNNGKGTLSEIPLQYTEVEKCMGEHETETIGGSKQKDIAHTNGPFLSFSEANEVLMGTEDTDNPMKKIIRRRLSRSIVSPDTFKHEDKMLEADRDAEEMGTQRVRITPDASIVCKGLPNSRYHLRSSSSLEKASVKSNMINDSSDMRQMNHAYDITWPKRKIMKDRSINLPATSPRLRVTQKHNNCSCRTSLNSTSDSSICFQPSILSSEMEVELPEAALDQCDEDYPSKKLRVTKDDHEIHDLTRDYLAAQSSLLFQHMDENHDLVEDYSAIIQPNFLSLVQQEVSQSRRLTLDDFGRRNQEQVPTGESSSSIDDSSGLSEKYGINLVCMEETMPEFEAFSISVPPIIEDEVTFSDSEISSLSKERASLLEQLCKSESMLAKESCLSTKLNRHKMPDAYHSLPTGIFKHLNLSNSPHVAGIDSDQFRTRKDDTDDYPSCTLGSELDGSLFKSTSYNFSSLNAKYSWEAGKPPLTPPVEKLQLRMISRKSVSSSEELGSNPELVCFRIDENSSISGEEPTSEQGSGSRRVRMSANRTALADVTSLYQNIPPSVSECDKYQERGSLHSSNTECRLERDYKDNDNLPVSQNSIQSSANSFYGQGSKPNASGEAEKRNRGYSASVSKKHSKPNNIVSNVSSFIPIVREKQRAAAPAIAKRDIKVKALEAAEAAKHLEEKRQHKRELRKAAAKLERIKLEHENMRQLELKQKQKEESRKKKEADLEVRKRQRELEKNEKQIKRRCTEEARKQQRVNIVKLHSEKGDKELRDKNANGKKRKGKELLKEAKKQTKEREVAIWRNTAEVEPSTFKVVSKEPGHASISGEAHVVCLEANDSMKVVENSNIVQNAIQDRMSVTAESRNLQSYEITPYKDSDDEDGDEDLMRHRKPVPSWARKETLHDILLSNCHLDPKEIFSRKRSFDLNEVLSR